VHHIAEPKIGELDVVVGVCGAVFVLAWCVVCGVFVSRRGVG
jgi:hypothetical protein